MRKSLVTLALALALALSASLAHADSESLYLGAGILRSSLSGISNAGVDYASIDKTSWKAFVGLRLLSVLALEADYMDLGSDSRTVILPGVGTCAIGQPNCANSSSHSDAKAYAGYAVGFLPIPLPFLDVFGKAGVVRWRLDGSALGPFSPPPSFSNSGTQFAWGIGTQLHAGNFGARLEYENFRVPHTDGANVVALEGYVNIF